jgi:hypothetical protein
MIATLPTAADVQADIIRDDLRTAVIRRRSLDAWVERCESLEARLEERNRVGLPLTDSLRRELVSVAVGLRRFGVRVPDFASQPPKCKPPVLERGQRRRDRPDDEPQSDTQAALDYVFDALLKPGLRLRSLTWHREHHDLVRAESGEEAAG